MRPSTSVAVTYLTTPARRRVLRRLGVDYDRTLSSLIEEGIECVAQKYGVTLPPRTFEKVEQPQETAKAG